MSDYKIGRGKPPKQYSFTKGVSGNPRGRPKGRRSLQRTIEATLNEKMVIREKGKKRIVTKLEATVRRLIDNAASGNVQSLRTLALFMPPEDTTTPATVEELAEQDRKVLEGLAQLMKKAS